MTLTFIRGTEGLKEKIINISKRTANIVGYIGEWHSHTDCSSTMFSVDDKKLLSYLYSQMANDGEPALMIIVGKEDLSFYI